MPWVISCRRFGARAFKCSAEWEARHERQVQRFSACSPTRMNPSVWLRSKPSRGSARMRNGRNLEPPRTSTLSATLSPTLSRVAETRQSGRLSERQSVGTADRRKLYLIFSLFPHHSPIDYGHLHLSAL